jgi:hypothetical protein
MVHDIDLAVLRQDRQRLFGGRAREKVRFGGFRRPGLDQEGLRLTA